MKTKTKRLLALMLALVLCVALFAGCNKEETPTASSTPTGDANSPAPTGTPSTSDVPLVVGYSPFSEKFSPFYADTSYDQDVVSMTTPSLLTTDRTGGIVYNAIEGETIEYNGTPYEYKGIANLEVNYDEATDLTTYTWTLRDDVKFSDGELMTADDVIFSYYVYLDPSYTGSATLYAVPIVGLNGYRNQMVEAQYDKYNALLSAMVADYIATKNGGEATGTYDAEQYAWLTEKIESTWLASSTQLVADVCAGYMDYADSYTPWTADQVTEDGQKIAMAMALWGFGSFSTDEEGNILPVISNGELAKSWDTSAGEYPTYEEFYQITCIKYGYDISAYSTTETMDAADLMEGITDEYMATYAAADEEFANAEVPTSVEGIKKISDTVVEITVEGFDATAVYQLGASIAPLHYYGDESKYDYENDKFGFDFGDLSGVQAKTTQPLGAGPYKFVKYENKVVYFEANEFYYKGAPKIKNVQFKETQDADKISGVGTGTIDLTDPDFSNDAVDEVKSYNSNGEIVGDAIETVTVDFLGYGYIGICAKNVKVGDDPASDASKDLRKAFATIFSVYRDVAVDSYYGERAAVINYPISNTSWAAPQKTDADYKIAYSTAVDGSDIYTSSMSADERYAAAIAAAVEYFKAAGYTYDEASGLFTAAPEGASLEYELLIPGDGKGDHPSFIICTMAKEALASIGINLIVTDLSDSTLLWDTIDAGTQEFWCAAWGATIDPDMYQVYYSNNVVGNPGSTESNHYCIQDSELDSLIVAARQSDDQAYRKATYKACLDIILDWGVEIPVYQRQECFIFSAERINLDTLTPDITTFWSWMNDIELLEMAS